MLKRVLFWLLHHENLQISGVCSCEPALRVYSFSFTFFICTKIHGLISTFNLGIFVLEVGMSEL